MEIYTLRQSAGVPSAKAVGDTFGPSRLARAADEQRSVGAEPGPSDPVDAPAPKTILLVLISCERLCMSAVHAA
jgi:hypothetical protein